MRENRWAEEGHATCRKFEKTARRSKDIEQIINRL